MSVVAAPTGPQVDEGSPRVLRGIGVPFNQPSLVADAIGGKLLVSIETFDEHSFVSLPEKVPVLVSHDSGQPIGWARPYLEPDALRVEARLEGGAAHVDHVVELVRAGLMAALSIGFIVGADDVWSKGPTPDAPPRVLRRGAKLRDVSLVTRPAYAAAQVETLRHRSALKIKSDEIMRPYLEECAQREAEARRAAQAQLDELDAWLEETRRRGDELRAVLEARQPAKPATRLTIDESGAGGLRWVVRVDDRGRTVEELGLLGAPVAARSMEQLGRSYLDVDIRAGTSYIVRRSPGGAVIEELGPLETG